MPFPFPFSELRMALYNFSRKFSIYCLIQHRTRIPTQIRRFDLCRFWNIWSWLLIIVFIDSFFKQRTNDNRTIPREYSTHRLDSTRLTLIHLIHKPIRTVRTQILGKFHLSSHICAYSAHIVCSMYLIVIRRHFVLFLSLPWCLVSILQYCSRATLIIEDEV